MKCTY